TIACAWPRGASCEIVMLADDEIIKAGYFPQIVRRHEESHCGGWPKNHPGQRLIPQEMLRQLTPMRTLAIALALAALATPAGARCNANSKCAGRPARSRWCKSTTMKE